MWWHKRTKKAETPAPTLTRDQRLAAEIMPLLNNGYMRVYTGDPCPGPIPTPITRNKLLATGRFDNPAFKEIKDGIGILALRTHSIPVIGTGVPGFVRVFSEDETTWVWDSVEMARMMSPARMSIGEGSIINISDFTIELHENTEDIVLTLPLNLDFVYRNQIYRNQSLTCPPHRCEFVTNPEKRSCDFHEEWAQRAKRSYFIGNLK